MQMTSRATPRALFVRIEGELDLHTAPEFKQRIEAELGAEPGRRVLVLVLSDVGFIDSSGLGALLAQYKALTERGGRLVLVDPRPAVRRVLQFSGLLRMLDVVETEEKALLWA